MITTVKALVGGVTKNGDQPRCKEDHNTAGILTTDQTEASTSQSVEESEEQDPSIVE